FSGRTVPLFDSMLVHQGEGSGTPTGSHHTPSPKAHPSPQHDLSSSIHLPVTTTIIPTVIPTDILTLRQYSRRARIAQSLALLTAADEPAFLLGDDSQGEACLTQTKMAIKIIAQDLEIASLKARIKLLEDKDGGGDEPSGEDATIKGRSLETEEEASVEKSTKRGSNDTEELVNVLTSLDAASILTSGVQMVSVPPAAEVTTKKKLQEQIDVQVAREMEEQIAREDQRMNEQIARDAKIARIHAKEELQMLIDSLDETNETISKYLHEYEQFATDLSIRERIELINDLVKYQDNYAKVLKYQSQQRKPLSKKQQREFYMSKQIEDCVPMGFKEERERVKRKGLRLEQESAKKMKTSEEVSKEDLKTMMQLVLVEEIIRLGGNTVVYQFFVDMPKHFDREDLNQLWTLVKETLSMKQATSDKEKELWVELKRLYEPDVEDQLWTQTQALMHDPVEWRLYDTCGVHHVLSKDQEIFMLVEREYPLRKGLAIVMISNKLQVENYSQMANDLILKIHKIANSQR
nr:hypothetical protein [Tanacetum cinerariifolium]